MALLELRNVAKHFGAIEALKGVDLDLAPGEVLGLMGDNGAGKSTLVKIIAGNFPPSEGEIRLGGRACHFHRPVDARAEGIEIVYQDLALCDNLTAAANVFLGREIKKTIGGLKVLDYRSMYERAAELFAELKSETRPRDLVKQMSGGQRQAVAIARTRLSEAKIVYQDLALCDNLTAAANVFLGREIKKTIGGLKVLDYRSMYERAAELFAELKSETRPRDLVKQMSGGQRQAVAIARTRLSEAKIVLMDEPTAAISVRQVAEVLDLIRRLRDRAIAVILISHRMPDVFAVCDRIAVLRRGRKVAEKAIADSSPEEVTGLITGAIQAA